MNELITVYITTHNRREKLERAVNSVLRQTYKNFEIIICDDASSDDTKDYVTALMEDNPVIRYVRNEENKGACATRNSAIDIARGKFITGLDDDDEFTENRLEVFVDNWDDKYSFLCANFIEKSPVSTIEHYKIQKNRRYIYTDLLYTNCASNQIFTTLEKITSVGGFDVRAKRLQDWDTWLRLSYTHGEFLFISKPLYIMHHDVIGQRVSGSYKYINALQELGERNKKIYSPDEYKILLFYISYYNKKLSFMDSLHWIFIGKDIKPIFRYFKQLTSSEKIN